MKGAAERSKNGVKPINCQLRLIRYNITIDVVLGPQITLDNRPDNRVMEPG